MCLYRRIGLGWNVEESVGDITIDTSGVSLGVGP